jgi:hypothetical protein
LISSSVTGGIRKICLTTASSPLRLTSCIICNPNFDFTTGEICPSFKRNEADKKAGSQVFSFLFKVYCPPASLLPGSSDYQDPSTKQWFDTELNVIVDPSI